MLRITHTVPITESKSQNVMIVIPGNMMTFGVNPLRSPWWCRSTYGRHHPTWSRIHREERHLCQHWRQEPTHKGGCHCSWNGQRGLEDHQSSIWSERLLTYHIRRWYLAFNLTESSAITSLNNSVCAAGWCDAALRHSGRGAVQTSRGIS